MTVYNSEKEIAEVIETDLKKALNAPFLNVEIMPPGQAFEYAPIEEAKLLDKIEIKTNVYEVDPSILSISKGSNEIIERYSNLLKSNCPITGQPDWATVRIKYKAKNKIEDSSLLKYFISYRNHQGYHEACCEMIFTHLFNLLNPELLTVECAFTRRGGIDINPSRSYGEKSNKDFKCHYWRQ